MSKETAIFLEAGVKLPVGSDRPFWIDDPDQAWFVAAGRVDVFALEGGGTEAAGAHKHLLRAAVGTVIFGWGGDGVPLPRIQAVGDRDTEVYRLPLAGLQAAGDSVLPRAVLGSWVDAWVTQIYQALADHPAPREALLAGAEETIELEAAASVRPEAGVLWVQPREAPLHLAGRESLTVEAGDGWMPLASSGWLVASAATPACFAPTGQRLADSNFWRHLAQFHALARRWVSMRLREEGQESAARLVAKAHAQEHAMRGAVERLSSVFLPRRRRELLAARSEDPLIASVQLVTEALGIPFVPPASSRRVRNWRDAMHQLARVSRLRTRRVVLRGEWWSHDSGPLLAFRKEPEQPVALLARSAANYELADPVSGQREPVDAEVAASLNPMAFAFYPAFGEGVLKVWEVLRFSFQGVRGDLTMVLVLTLAGVLLGLVVPVVTGVIFDQVIPGADRPQLWFLAVALGVTAFTDILLNATYSIAMVRVETKSETTLQAAVWDRLLRLPLPFFRNFTAGDLANRAQGINSIRQILTGAMMGSLLSGVFSSLSFALLCYYSPTLTLVACGLVLLNLLATALVSGVSLRMERPVYEASGRLSGQVLQFITGITKLRVAGAEAHAFGVWARDFARFKTLDLRVERLSNAFGVFLDIFPLATSIVLFAGMQYLVAEQLSIGRFLAFSATFMMFLESTIAASGAVLSLVSAVPLYERTKPILEAVPEVTEGKSDPGTLAGRIELSHLNFRYKPGDPLVLQDVSIQVQPGEFVALVGPSGSGKSTLLRLLLGFERPDSGTIYVDGMDLAGLDIQAVRRQFGVVLQNGKLMPGDIFRNIVGTSLLTLDDAWEAARQAGLERDIREMPMGMHTVLGEGTGTLSGGQRQRLMIARAIVRRPRVLLFDEATSALDNRTQAIVSRSLESMNATRLVIAHRLSTIQAAHRIHVLDKGRIVQSGNFAELSSQPGLFAALMQRQLT